MTDSSYGIRVAGLVPQGVLAHLEGVTVAEQEFRTMLSGRFEDQAALHGFLHLLRDYGLEIVEVRKLTSAPEGEEQEGAE